MLNQKAVLIFGGTTEGRELCEHLYASGIPFTACVATEYGEECLSHMPGADVRTGRLYPEEIAALVPAYALVVDATHPYAAAVSAHISAACHSVPSIRVLRPSPATGNCRYFADIPEAAAYLGKTDGPVLVTTGSKELAAYCAVPGYRKRLYVRVLPSADSIQECLSRGIPSSHIIAMQGPFSTELNLALLRQTGARFLVTKESGPGGGYSEKLRAAEAAGAAALVIGRPVQEAGLSLSAAIAEIDRIFKKECGYFPLFFNLKHKPVTVVGGGKIALRRIKALLPFGPRLTVIAPEAEPLPEEIVFLQRPYQKGDTDGAFLVLAATGDPQINSQIAADCRAAGIPVNRCDDRNGCDFYFPALFQNETLIGGLVSKQGNSHSLVKETARLLGNTIKEVPHEAADWKP